MEESGAIHTHVKTESQCTVTVMFKGFMPLTYMVMFKDFRFLMFKGLVPLIYMVIYLTTVNFLHLRFLGPTPPPPVFFAVAVNRGCNGFTFYLSGYETYKQCYTVMSIDLIPFTQCMVIDFHRPYDAHTNVSK